MSALTRHVPASPSGLWAGPSRFRSLTEAGVGAFLLLCATITVLTTAGIILVLGLETLEFFEKSKVGLLHFLTGTVLNPEGGKYGILPLIWGTFQVAAGSSVIALPIGLLSAIYLSEYAPSRVRAVLKPALELLAGIPTIVYGYLALLLVTPVLKAIFEPMGIPVSTFNVASACIVVGVMIIPLVSSLSEDVLSAVPRGLREAGYALGATKFEVSTRIVLPAGLSGVMASFILAVSRAIGETMAVVLAAGMRPQITLNPFDSCETMTTYIVSVTGGEASYGSPEYLSLFAVGMALFLSTLALNLLSEIVLRRYREVYR
ncbi:MAG: phosphate ABC transporter permease subunit PstC [Planctomycetaceae bacterium]|nr:phosphate ABC transporter permease subunit PstC [Planctomycetaceae bacterium]MBV8557623.1 phosphate ABC transporter permease subunit PstC [Planctomycetaceae bacterium]